MGKRANPMAVKASLTYEVGEAAAALDKPPTQSESIWLCKRGFSHWPRPMVVGWLLASLRFRHLSLSGSWS
jgi:hypothetical protein